MKMYLISDNEDTRIGMRLAGVEGVTVSGREEFADAVSKALEDKSIGILLVTSGIADTSREMIDSMKLGVSVPLIVEIPDRNGAEKDSGSITRYIREAIGLNI